MNATNGVLMQIPIGKIRANPNNSRREVRGPGFESFKENLRSQGQLQPGIARPHPVEAEAYELLAGHRRFAGLQDIGAATMDLVVRAATDQEALVVRAATDQEALVVLASENLQREDLTHLEEGEDVRKLLASGLNHKEVAAALGKSLAWVYRRDRLNELHLDLRSQAGDPSTVLGRMSVEYLEEIAAFPADVQARWVKTGPWTRAWTTPTLEGLKQWIGNEMKLVARAPFDIHSLDLVPAAGACSACPKRSSCSAGVFGLQDVEPGEVGKRDQCLDVACWASKLGRFRDQALEAALKANPKIRLLEGKDDGLNHNEKKGFARVVDARGWERCKKNALGAFEGLVLSGSSAGKTVWARQDHYDEREHKPAVTAADDLKEAGPKEKAKALAHNRQVLEFRRQAWALGALAGHLQEEGNRKALAQPLVSLQVLDLAVMFGWANGFQATAPWDGKGLRKLYEQERKVEDLLAAVLPTMAARLFCMKATEASDRQTAHAEFFCELFNLDWKGFLAKAAEAIKEPKSWAALEDPEKKKSELAAALEDNRQAIKDREAMYKAQNERTKKKIEEQCAREERAEKSRTEKPGKDKGLKVEAIKESAAWKGILTAAKPKGKAKPAPKEKRARPGLQLQDKEPAERPIEDLVSEDLKKLETEMFPKKKAKGKPKAAGKKGGGK